MAHPSSDVDICNIALDVLNEPPISSLDTPSNKAEKLMARHYDQVRRETLAKFVWNFAKKRAVLARSGTPAFDYDDAYKLPSDYVRFVSVGGANEISYTNLYDVEGDDILVNNGGSSSLKLRYVSDFTDVTKFSPLFVKLFTLYLAEAISYKLTGTQANVERVNKQIEIHEKKAKSVEGQERPPKKREVSRSLAARRGHARSLGVADDYTRFD